MDAQQTKKLRHSVMRERIYDYLCSTTSHPSADMIYNALKESCPSLSLGTVYRNLKQLEQLGKVIRVTSVNDCERYDAFCRDHVHFVCDRCGQVIDLPEIDPDEIRHSCALKSAHTSQRISVLLGGTCRDCLNK